MIQHYTISNKQGVGRFMADLATRLNAWDGENPLRIQITERKPTRTQDQNKLYWKWIDLIADEIGEDNDTVHDALRLKFLTVKVSKIDNRAVASSTTKLNTKEMAEYMGKVEYWAITFLNMTLPCPDDLIDYSSYER